MEPVLPGGGSTDASATGLIMGEALKREVLIREALMREAWAHVVFRWRFPDRA